MKFRLSTSLVKMAAALGLLSTAGLTADKLLIDQPEFEQIYLRHEGGDLREENDTLRDSNRQLNSDVASLSKEVKDLEDMLMSQLEERETLINMFNKESGEREKIETLNGNLAVANSQLNSSNEALSRQVRSLEDSFEEMSLQMISKVFRPLIRAQDRASELDKKMKALRKQLTSEKTKSSRSRRSAEVEKKIVSVLDDRIKKLKDEISAGYWKLLTWNVNNPLLNDASCDDIADAQLIPKRVCRLFLSDRNGRYGHFVFEIRPHETDGEEAIRMLFSAAARKNKLVK